MNSYPTGSAQQAMPMSGDRHRAIFMEERSTASTGSPGIEEIFFGIVGHGG
jgi:hypothetical protein